MYQKTKWDLGRGKLNSSFPVSFFYLACKCSTADYISITKCFSNLVKFLSEDPIETSTLVNHALSPIIVLSGKQGETFQALSLFLMYTLGGYTEYKKKKTVLWQHSANYLLFA